MKNFTNSDMEKIFCEIFGSYDVCNTKSSSTKNSTTKSSTATATATTTKSSKNSTSTSAHINGYNGPVEMDFSESGELGLRPSNMDHKTFWYKVYQEKLAEGRISEICYIELCNRLFK